MLSKCHDNCFSCNNGPIKISSNNIQSMECIKCKDSYRAEKDMIKIDNNCFKILQYSEYKILFNISEINPENHLGSCK